MLPGLFGLLFLVLINMGVWLKRRKGYDATNTPGFVTVNQLECTPAKTSGLMVLSQVSGFA